MGWDDEYKRIWRVYIEDERLKPNRNRISFPLWNASLAWSYPFSIWEFSWREIPFLLWFRMSCFASHYFIGRYLVIWIRIYMWGNKSPPRKSVRIFMSECDVDCCESKVHAESSRSVVGGLRWPASTTDAGDAWYRDSDWCCCIWKCQLHLWTCNENRLGVYKNIPRD